MTFIPVLTTALKAFAAFWSLVVWAVSASFISKSNDYFGSGAVNNSNFAAGNALIAAGILSMLYFCAVLFFTFTRPEHVLISVMVDTVFLGFFFIFYLASSAALSTEASFFSRWDDGDAWASLGNAALGLGWVMTFLILGILLFQVIYTLKKFGGAYSTWRMPFNQLAAYGTGTPASTVPMSSVSPQGQGQGQGAAQPAHTPATVITNHQA